MDDWKVFANYFVPDGFLFKFDTKSGYHHMDICPDHQQFWGFQWPLNSTKMRYFCFTVSPFWAIVSSLFVHEAVSTTSRSLALHQLALDIFCFCLQNNIILLQWRRQFDK